MDELSLIVMEINGIFKLSIQPVTEESSQVYFLLMCIFGSPNNQKLEINFIQKLSQQMKDDVKLFVETYSARFPPLNKLSKRISEIPNDQYFFILPEDITSTKQKLELELYLSCLNSTETIEEAEKLFETKCNDANNLIGELLSNYDFHQPRVDKRTVIGTTRKELRKCRFCLKSVRDGVSFKKVAHAISEGLGNKNLILCDECDTCNEFFGTEIEPSLIEFFDVYRVFMGVKGKNGIPKIKYRNGEISNDGKMAVVMSQDISGSPEQSLKVHLKSSKKFTPIKLYKSLCKMALSVISESELDSLKNTIKWIRFGEMGDKTLPKIAVNVIHSNFSIVPQILVYTRKTDNTELPHVVGEFKFGSYIYVFILPFSERDTVDFLDEKSFDDFWKMFRHYNQVPNWGFHDYNSNQEVTVNENITMVNSSTTT